MLLLLLPHYYFTITITTIITPCLALIHKMRVYVLQTILVQVLWTQMMTASFLPAEIPFVDNPFSLFRQWWENATDKVPDYYNMCLSTSTKDGKSSSRIVNVAGFNESGIRFFTDCSSKKGKEIEENPYASATIYWPGLSQQIRFEGTVENLPRQDVTEYFYGLDRERQITLEVGNQDGHLTSRNELLKERKAIEDQFPDHKKLPVPSNWSGYLIVPHRFVFYQGQFDWLSDRVEYTKHPNGSWALQRLKP